MEELNLLLGIITNIFTILLLVVAIIIGIRIIGLTDKAEKILDDVEEKINSLNGIFNVVNKVSLGMDAIGNKITSTITNLVSKVSKKKKEEKEDE